MHHRPADRAATLASPFAKLNLRRNPFGELTRQQRAELAVCDVQPWLEWLAAEPASALQFLGDCGRGKTTHLLALQLAWPVAAYVYLPECGPQPSIPDTRPLLLDEAQRLGGWRRRHVLKRGGPLVFGTHQDLTRTLVRRGFRVLTVDVAAEQSPERLGTILNRRIEACRLTSDAIPSIGLEEVFALQRAWGSDIRRIERVLYDRFQELLKEQA